MERRKREREREKEPTWQVSVEQGEISVGEWISNLLPRTRDAHAPVHHRTARKQQIQLTREWDFQIVNEFKLSSVFF